MLEDIEKYKMSVAEKVRSLRLSQRWTQKELAGRLGISQSRLSEIERGKGSFTAQQFLIILRLFNVGVAHFGLAAADRTVELQNTLARLGARHLGEPDQVLPADSHDVSEAVQRALVSGSPRLVTALGPVLVRNIDHTNLKGLQVQLATAGLPQRLPWLVENVLEAIGRELDERQPRRWGKLLRRARVVLKHLMHQLEARPMDASPLDILDAEIRSERTLEEVKRSSSQLSQRWGVVTRIVPEDFVHALQKGRADD